MKPALRKMEGLGEAGSNVATALDARARPFLDLVDGLRALGLQRDMPIPQVAVMGDQSSGKSSVLEAISGIAFPRGSGLVTRCATQISMGAGEKWSAEIRAGSGGESVSIENPEDVTAKIETMTAGLCGGEDFCSDDIIEIKLRAPALPDLTIIDLPGIVRTATKDQSEDVIGQVDRLLHKYLSQERTVILAVIPASSDIATVDILERAAKVDPDSSRTMGVLTKPDLVDAGGEAEVLGVLSNITKPLKHGYFMVKNRSQKESDDGVSLDAARAKEMEWFEETLYVKRRNVLGVKALTSALSSLLVGRIEAAIPLLQKEVHLLLAEAKAELLKLGPRAPETPGSCRLALREISRKWLSSMRRVCAQADYEELQDVEYWWEERVDVTGAGGDENCEPAAVQKPVYRRKTEKSLFVLREQKHLRASFFQRVIASRPGFDGEDDLLDGVIVERYNDQHQVGDTVKSWKRKSCQSVTRVGEEVEIENANGEEFARARVTRVSPYFRGDLKDTISLGRGRELPGFMNFGIFKSLMASYARRWNPPAITMCSGMRASVQTAGLHFFKMHTEEHPYAEELREFLGKVFQAHLKKTESDASLGMKTLLEQETEIPMTMNHYLWDTINHLRDDQTLRRLRVLESPTSDLVCMKEVIAALKSDIVNESNESQEVNDMLDMLKAYWKLAMKRYVDGICHIVSNAYTSDSSLDAIAQRLDMEQIRLDDAEVQRIFTEPPSIAMQRCELQRKIERLTEAKQRLIDF